MADKVTEAAYNKSGIHDWKSFKIALNQGWGDEAVAYVKKLRKEKPSHADHCERLLFHYFNGQGKWELSLWLANSSVKGKEIERSRLERLKQLMEVWGDQEHEVYAKVVEALKS